MMRMSTKVKCPYCGFEQDVVVEVEKYAPRTGHELVRCDVEEGGCDELFVVSWKVAVTATARAIEKEEQERVDI